MNREIKFRGYNYQFKKWFYGSLFIQKYDNDLMLSNSRTTIIDDRGFLVMVDNGTIGQYTGLQDKNGVEIYEGDICKGNEFSDDNDLFIIKYGKYKTSDWKEKYICNTYQYGWFAEYIETKTQVHLVIPNGIKVIGNIYENEVEEVN